MRRRGERGVRKQRRELRVAPKRSSLGSGKNLLPHISFFLRPCSATFFSNRARWASRVRLQSKT